MGTLDAGWDEPPKGPLPIDSRNPIVLCNDGPFDNWQGEYAMLFAKAGGPALTGIVINTSPAGTDLDANIAGWQEMVDAARQSGLSSIPDPRRSTGPVLVRPSDGSIESTQANRSEGALFIIETSKNLSTPFRPLVLVTGGRLTDVADAYLTDPTVVDRVVVVSALGTSSGDGGAMGIPNGEMDPWADVIVTAKFRYVQVSGYYDQKLDMPDGFLSHLPSNAWGAWVRAKQTKVYDDRLAADQVSVLAVAMPSFVSSVVRVAPQGMGSSHAGPTLANDPNGPVWLVSEVDGAAARARFQKMLEDPATYR